MQIDVSTDTLRSVETPKAASEIVTTVRKRSNTTLESIAEMDESDQSYGSGCWPCL